MADRPTIVFVHGMFMTGASWEPWSRWFEARGHHCIVEHWPGREGTPAALRARPDPILATLRLSQVVAGFRKVVMGLPAPPVLVGHSMGGLVVQLLMQEGLGERGIAIASAPPAGVRSFAWSHLRSNAALLAPTSAPVVPSLAWFRYAFANVQSEAEVAQMFERDVVPESRLVGKGSLGDEGSVDFARPDRPLHFIAGGSDHIIPRALVEKTVARYRQAGARVSFEAMAGRTHALCIDAGWQDVAVRVEACLEA